MQLNRANVLNKFFSKNNLEKKQFIENKESLYEVKNNKSMLQ